MAIYDLSEVASERQKRKLQKVRLSQFVIFMLLFLIVSFLYFNSTGHHSDLYQILWIGLLVFLVNLWNPFGKRNIYGDIASRLQMRTVEIRNDGLSIEWMAWGKFIPWNDVTRVEEPPAGRGLYFRTRSRFVWYLISRKNPHYDEIKGELAVIGIPIVPATAPWNWGILFVFFCASLLCNLLTQDRLILSINFAFALTFGVAGAIMTKYSIGDPHLRLRSILGSFLPAAFSGICLIFPLGLK